MPGETKIIGVGNAFRCDDAVGLEVIRRLRALTPDSVELVEHGGEGGSLLDTWQGADTVFVIDAVFTQGAPGTVLRFDAVAAPLPAVFGPLSGHAFGVEAAIELARALGQLPRRLVVYGIEGKVFDAGTGLSPEVEEAAEDLAKRITEELTAN